MYQLIYICLINVLCPNQLKSAGDLPPQYSKGSSHLPFTVLCERETGNRDLPPQDTKGSSQLPLQFCVSGKLVIDKAQMNQNFYFFRNCCMDVFPCKKMPGNVKLILIFLFQNTPYSFHTLPMQDCALILVQKYTIQFPHLAYARLCT